MSWITFQLNEVVTVKRRESALTASRDSLNNPVYGAPTATWNLIYPAMPVRFAFRDKGIQFAPTGERLLPNGVMYFDKEYDLQVEDRVLTATGVEYVVTAITLGYQMPSVVSHKEAKVELP
jgi:hypothetical protein